MADPVIQTFRLTKIYRHPFFFWKVQARALTDLDMRIDRGEIFGLLGPNGSGKSTAIKILLGLLFPTSGAAAVFGKRPESISIKSRIGFLPEESYLYRFLDAEETLDFFGRLFGLTPTERKRRTDMLLDMTGLARERKRAVAEYSKGMQRRLGIASCLINDPELIIMDEPTSGLDPLGSRQVKDILLELKKKGKTVLLSSHLLADVEDVCDRVTILYGGRAQAEGPVKKLLGDAAKTQITTKSLPVEVLNEVRELLRNKLGDDIDLEVSAPTMRLEDYFLDVVKSAREKRLTTSGAEAGMAASSLSFLSQSAEEKQDALIEKLTQTDESIEQTKEGMLNTKGELSAPVALASDEQEKREALLAALTSGAKEEEEEREKQVAAAVAPAPESREAKVNYALLDALTKPEE